MTVNERIKYLKENYESLSAEDLKAELKETKSKMLSKCLESLISIKEAESVDVEFTTGVGHGGAREGAGRPNKGPKKTFLGLSYKFMEEDVDLMKENFEKYKEKNGLKTTTEALRKLFMEDITNL